MSTPELQQQQDTRPPEERPRFTHALDSIMEELLAMNERRLVPVNVDIPSATLVVIGCEAKRRRLRPEMVEWFGDEMAAAVDRLELLAHAVDQAHVQHRLAQPEIDLAAVAAEARQLRATLLAEVAWLTERKLIPRNAVRLRGGSGFANLAFELLQLVALFRRASNEIAGVSLSADTMSELVRAEVLADQLITELGIRTQRGRSPTANVRQRAFTLLSETYDRVRRMVVFLRWERRRG